MLRTVGGGRGCRRVMETGVLLSKDEGLHRSRRSGWRLGSLMPASPMARSFACEVRRGNEVGGGMGLKRASRKGSGKVAGKEKKEGTTTVLCSQVMG